MSYDDDYDDDEDDPRFSADGEMTSAAVDDPSEDDNSDDLSLEILQGDEIEQGALYSTPCSYIGGCAGTGKSFHVRQQIEQDPQFAVLSSSTGVSAVNLNATTIHSLLGFFDTDSLRTAYHRGFAPRALRRLMDDGYRNVVIDECSMISNATLDLLVCVFDDVNEGRAAGTAPIGLVLVGDFAQLPAIADKPRGWQKGTRRKADPTPWAFKSESWPRFAQNVTRLTKIWRQDNPTFLAALNHARAGQGDPAVSALRAAGADFASGVNMEFDGTTIVGTNEEADRINREALLRVQGRGILLPARRWGNNRYEWKHIPEKTILKENAYVTLLANKKINQRDFEYVNGDCAWVRSIQPSTDKSSPPTIMVELVRTGQEVAVGPLVRHLDHYEKPSGVKDVATVSASEDTGGYLERVHYRSKERRYVTGQVMYYPIRLAYASTCHRAQGLTLDRVQIDTRHWMWQKQAAMLYVACSRARTPQGLRLVGMPEKIAKCFVCDEKVRPWL